MIYDGAVHRRSLVVIGALAFAGVAVASGAHAEEADTSTTTTPSTRQPTTTAPPITLAPTTTTPPRSTTTVRTTGGTTTTTVKGGPKPPPASGASQPLDPSLLGGVGPIDLNPSTTTTLGGLFGTEDELTTTTTFLTNNAINVASSHSGPSGAMLGLAAVAWVASLGGLLIYAEDQRGKQWRHLAR